MKPTTSPQVIFATCYFGLYLDYLFWHQEGELLTPRAPAARGGGLITDRPEA